jgi:hypothetical protein
MTDAIKLLEQALEMLKAPKPEPMKELEFVPGEFVECRDRDEIREYMK